MHRRIMTISPSKDEGTHKDGNQYNAYVVKIGLGCELESGLSLQLRVREPNKAYDHEWHQYQT